MQGQFESCLDECCCFAGVHSRTRCRPASQGRCAWREGSEVCLIETCEHGVELRCIVSSMIPRMRCVYHVMLDKNDIHSCAGQTEYSLSSPICLLNKLVRTSYSMRCHFASIWHLTTIPLDSEQNKRKYGDRRNLQHPFVISSIYRTTECETPKPMYLDMR